MATPAENSAVGGPVLFLFDTTHAAMEAEETIIDAGFWCDIVPRPAEVAVTLCGLAIEVQPNDAAEIEQLLKAAGLTYELYRPPAAAPPA